MDLAEPLPAKSCQLAAALPCPRLCLVIIMLIIIQVIQVIQVNFTQVIIMLAIIVPIITFITITGSNMF